MGGYRPAPEIDKQTYSKYNPAYPMQLNYYVFISIRVVPGGNCLLSFQTVAIYVGRKSAG
jgi:hypothetical protein